MGLFDAIKKAFDAGGIKVAMEAPKSFAWSDASIPVTVTLTGHKTEPRTVTALEFTLEEDEDDFGPGNSGNSGNRVSSAHDGKLTYTRTETIELQPLQVVTIEAQVPLAQEAVTTRDGLAERILDAIVFSGKIRFSSPAYKLSVYTTVEGAAASKGTSKSIRNSDVKFSSSISFT